MEIRSLKLNFVEGQITGISLNVILDDIYKKLFQNVRRSSRRNPNDVEHGIKVIIFGCFWLESVSNELLRFVLEKESQDNEFRKALWKKLRRSNIQDKLELFAAIGTQSQRDKMSTLLPNLKKVFDLRNRLAHFKDQDTQLAGEVDLKETIKIIESLPIPDLNRELMWPQIFKYAEIISKTNIWLNSFKKAYTRRKGIKTTEDYVT